MKNSTLFRLVLMLVLAGAYFFGASAQSAATLVIGTTDVVGEGGLEPTENYDFYGFHVMLQTHEFLCTEEPGTAKIIAELAQSCDLKDVASADGLTYTFKLLSGVTFTDGTPLTAANVAYSFKRALALDGSPVQALYDDDIKDVKALDASTVQFTLKQPDGTFLARIPGVSAGFILSFNSVQKDKNGNDVGVDKNTGGLQGTPDLQATIAATGTAINGTIGTGPYVLKQYVPGQLAVFEAYPDYWGCKVTPKVKCPNINQVVEEHFNTSPSLAASLLDGSVDMAWRGLALPDLNQVQGNAKFVVFKLPPGSGRIRYINFDVAKAPYDDLRVRKAIALAVDRDAIASKVFGGQAAPIYTMVPQGFTGQSVDVFNKQPDLAGASALLQKDGFSASNRLEADLWHENSGHYGTTESDVAAVVQDSLSKVPELDVVLKPIDWPGLGHAFLAPERKADFFLLGWFPDYVDGLDYTDPFLGSGSASLGIFFAELTDKGLDALPADSTTAQLLKAKGQAVNGKNIVQLMNDLIRDATVSTDPAVRNQDFANIQKITADVVPQIPLYSTSYDFTTPAQKNVGGVVQDAGLWLRDWLITKQ